MQARQDSKLKDFKDEAKAGEEVLDVFDSVEANQFFIFAYLVGYCRIRVVARIVREQLDVVAVEEFQLSKTTGSIGWATSLNLADLSVGFKVVGNRMVVGNTCFLKQR